ncbi:MAG: NUDIX hydrolase [Oscillospiraceae bacterium]|nr:NUDIX hydrolase [Oscillospiraceae bacterium]
MTPVETVRKIISDYTPQDEREIKDKELIQRYLSEGHDALLRTDVVGHFTASAWITDPTRTMVLMAFHNIYKHWAWIGGHADGDGDLFAVAGREAVEETSVPDLKPVSTDPVSIEVLGVTSHIKRGEVVSAHLHFNVTYLFEADPNSPVFIKEDENSAVGWRTSDQILSPESEPEMIPIYTKLLDRMKKL